MNPSSQRTVRYIPVRRYLNRPRTVFQNDAKSIGWSFALIGRRISIILKTRPKNNYFCYSSRQDRNLEIDYRTSNIINEFHGIEMEKKRKSFRLVFILVPRPTNHTSTVFGPMRRPFSLWKPTSDPFRFKSVTFDLEKGRTSRSIGIPADMFKKDYALAPPEAFNDLNSERLNDFKGIITNFALNTTSKSSVRPGLSGIHGRNPVKF